MKKIRNRQFIFQTITSLAFSLAVVAANTRCAYIYHQPKKPEELKTLRKLDGISISKFEQKFGENPIYFPYDS